MAVEDFCTYAKHAVASYSAERRFFIRRSDPSLLQTISLTLCALKKGYAPAIACEFGQQVSAPILD